MASEGNLDGDAMKVDQIQIGFRYRKDLGDLRSLADSIGEVGLLHPVVVTLEGRLIAGQRRQIRAEAFGIEAVARRAIAGVGGRAGL